MPKISELTEEEKIAKLPTWAQAMISKYKADAKHWEAKALCAAGELSGTNTYIRNGMDQKGLPPDSVIRFGHEDEYVDVYLHNGILNVQGNAEIAVYPRAGNMLHIRPARR